jgi:alpha-tubulin suppressor-like RCC1 family protein
VYLCGADTPSIGDSPLQRYTHLEQIIDAELGYTFGVALSRERKVYVWGTQQNRDGVFWEKETPVEIPTLSQLNIQKIATGWAQCLLLDDKRHVWEFCETYDFRDQDDSIVTPEDARMLPYENVVDIVCGSYISFILVE